MTLGAALLLFCVGAILTFAVNYEVRGVDLDLVGVILMVVGLVGALASLVLYSNRRRDVVVEERDVDRPL